MDIKLILRNNMKSLQAMGYFKSNRSLSVAAGVSSATINTFTVESDTTHPKINKLEEVAQSLKVPAWSLIIEDFPFDQYSKNKFNKFSKEGIELAQIANKLDDNDLNALIEYARFIATR